MGSVVVAPGAVVVLPGCVVPGDEVVVSATLSLGLGDDAVVEVVAAVVVVIAAVVVVIAAVVVVIAAVVVVVASVVVVGASVLGGTVGCTTHSAAKMASPLSFQFNPGKCPPV
jgi:hypothetical protein